MLPLKLLVSTVLSTTGTSKTLVAFNSATLLLMIVWRSKLVTPKSIWGCRSIIATTQLSGVNRPFSLRFVAMISSLFLVLLCSVFLNPLRSKAIVMPTDEMFGLRRNCLRTVTYQLRNRRQVTMDNCQRAGTCQPAGTSLPVDLTAARVPRCGLSKRGKEANIQACQAVNPSGIVFAFPRAWEIQ